MHGFLNEILVIFLAAAVTVPLFKLFKQGAILAYLFAGVLIGPQMLGFINDPAVKLQFSELGVVFLLFLIGLELNSSLLWKMRKDVFGLGLCQVVLTGLVFTFIGSTLGLGLSISIIAGFGLALSSTAFGLQILDESRQRKTLHGQGSFSILLFQDLAVIPLMALIPILTQGHFQGPGWVNVLKFVLIIVSLMLFGRYVIPVWFRAIAESRVQEVFIATSLLIVIGTGVLLESVGLSMGMGAFLAGMMLANSEYRHELESNLGPFKGLLMGLFFMSVGMSLNLKVVMHNPGTVILLLLGLLVLKAAIVYGVARLFRFPKESSRNMAATLPQGGEFAFVLFASATQFGLFQDEISSILNAVVTLSMAATPFVFSFNQKRLRSYSELSERPMDQISSEGSTVIIAGFGRFGQIVARFLNSQKVKYSILEHSAAQVDTARKFGTKIFYGDASRESIVEAAGAKEAKIFVLAIDDVDTSIKTAKMVKEKFPHLEIIARVRNRQHAIELMELGISKIHRETLLTSLEVAKETLMSLGHRREEINTKLAIFRKHDEEVLKNQLKLKDDEKSMIRYVTAASEELNQILTFDQKEPSGTIKENIK